MGRVSERDRGDTFLFATASGRAARRRRIARRPKIPPGPKKDRGDTRSVKNCVERWLRNRRTIMTRVAI
eukprot:7820738-Pyramimonas_sp.AAC.1